MDQIKKLYKTELSYLNDAIKDGNSPYHTFTLSSLNNNFPEARTIVLRNLVSKPLKIFFNADYRSPKVKELLSTNDCSALFYDQQRRVQIRFSCKAIIHYQNDISKKVWQSTLLQSRKCYMGPFAPSQKLTEWHPNIPSEYLKSDPEKKHSEEGYINFSHIELEVIESDMLFLHHDGHIRFKIDNAGNSFYISP
tara:strand:+ start:739 stop:1320 length:582 start_codon:yes stop_codon:yes gene_type:complete